MTDNLEETIRVLCIEDDPAMIELVTLILKNRGYDVRGASSGQEGLDLINDFDPNLILLDLMMPDMSGWDVYTQIRANDGTREIPVIVVTAKAQNIDKVLGLRIAKVQDYIVKPFSPAELIESVEKVLSED
ncbi:MAG: response regulator [Chloroflexi bacterium]|nr:response regulator [Chloroflexota bacterium]